MCVSTSEAGDKPVYTLAAVGMGLAWMWLKALVKGLHLVKEPRERFSGRLAALRTVLNFGGNTQQPGAFLWKTSTARKQRGYVKKTHMILKKVKVHGSYRVGLSKVWATWVQSHSQQWRRNTEWNANICPRCLENVQCVGMTFRTLLFLGEKLDENLEKKIPASESWGFMSLLLVYIYGRIAYIFKILLVAIMTITSSSSSSSSEAH